MAVLGVLGSRAGSGEVFSWVCGQKWQCGDGAESRAGEELVPAWSSKAGAQGWSSWSPACNDLPHCFLLHLPPAPLPSIHHVLLTLWW